MKLSGNCKEEFDTWKNGKGIENFKPKEYSLDIVSCFCDSMLVEFFDSVGIYISIPYLDEFAAFVGDEWCGDYKIRNEATNAAIKKANEIFNKKK